MKLLTRLAGLMIVVVAFSATIAGAQEPTAGVVRISDQDTVGTQMKLQSHAVQKELGCETDPAGECDQCDNCNGRFHFHNFCDFRGLFDDMFTLHRYRGDCPRCQHQGFHQNCEHCKKGNCPYHHQHADYNPNCPHCKNGNCPYHNGKKSKAQNRFGYFRPGNLPPFGCYTIGYPINPGYVDQRDGAMYAAQGYGVNVSVPLAPNVGAVYNYGWGVPSSRLTPVANPLPAPPMPHVVRHPQTQVMPRP
ncbi:MAG: hypothetical protein HUJ26_09855 [Planctomycetaceae bacterium]|nr:hypothetical protein [Planctomycetaceae bacterium]